MNGAIEALTTQAFEWAELFFAAVANPAVHVEGAAVVDAMKRKGCGENELPLTGDGVKKLLRTKRVDLSSPAQSALLFDALNDASSVTVTGFNVTLATAIFFQDKARHPFDNFAYHAALVSRKDDYAQRKNGTGTF